MRGVLILLAVLPTALCQLVAESSPRPSYAGYSAINGVCDASRGTMPGEVWAGRAGTLKQCTKRCSDLNDCKGFNFVTDAQQCVLFREPCSNTVAVGSGQPAQNFYRKGEISCSTSTLGREFYVAFMANRVTQAKNMALEIWVTQDQSVNPITVTFQIHPSMTGAWNFSGSSTQRRVGFQQVVPTLIPYTWKVSDVDSGVKIEKKAVKVSSNSDFVLYGVNKELYTADSFLGIPSRALGTRYVANCHWPPFYNCEFAITSAESGTTVTITLPRIGATKNKGKWDKPPTAAQTAANRCNIQFQQKTYTNGDSFTFHIDEFDVAQIQDPCDLTGTIIEADGHIAVWSGDSRVNIGDSPSRDHLVEQLFSTDTWGYDCAAWPTPNRAANLIDYWVITAAFDNTRVRVDSSELATVYHDLNAGESVRFPANSVNEWMRFSSDTKIQAVQYSHSASDPKIPGDPSMTVCIPSDQFGFGYTFVTPTGVSSSYVNFMTIITKTGNQNGFQLDGKPISGISWKNIPNSNLVGGYVQLDTSVKQQFRISHATKGVNFEAYIYGAGDRESIGYPTGACVKAIGDCSQSTMVVADGKDNDCDSAIDEELCDNIDNDLDGLVDEDCYARTSTDRCPSVNAATACYGNQLQLSCDDGTINIVDAHFGRIGQGGELVCGAENAVDSCTNTEMDCGFSDISAVLNALCDGQRKCAIPITDQSVGSLYAASRCPKCGLYATAQYACLNQKEQGFSALTGSNYAASSWLSVSGIAPTCTAKSCSSSAGLTAMSVYHPSQASFTTGNARGWRPSQCDKDSSWLQVDLGGQYPVGWYAISGCRRENYWITKFGISYSLDGKQWTNILDGSSLHPFTGNSDSSTVNVCDLFSYNIIARWVRIWPLNYNEYPCAHVDFGHNTTLQTCKPREVAHSNFEDGTTAPYGVTVSVNCKPGWSTANGLTSYEVTCGPDGQWIGNFRDCSTFMYCPDIPQIPGGYTYAPNVQVGSTATFTCFRGTLRGKNYSKCLHDGHWSEDLPTCDA